MSVHTRIRTNLEFHAAVWQATHNPVLVDLLERLTTHFLHAGTRRCRSATAGRRHSTNTSRS